MPVIRITDVTWDRLKRWAVPLEDSAEDAIRKVLDAAEEHLKCPQAKKLTPNTTKATRRILSNRLPKGVKTPQSAYNQPILEAIYELGGSAPVEKVLQVVEKKMKGLLTDVDYQRLPNTDSVRWKNTAQWARFRLVKDRLLASASESPRGVWKLSSSGLRQIEQRIKHVYSG